ncbi:hypothetical protein DFH05DRAFT_1458288 [Lentinula detonsa]|uniref:Uncharacterized protein n=1 Tax=Lentinula detonsa TaxID=2804962 RepID=A0A9W8P6U6_9AGAR|nr:hypothetical protein DFH05DRAFT_1458288 [Lentinula detonsa]
MADSQSFRNKHCRYTTTHHVPPASIPDDPHPEQTHNTMNDCFQDESLQTLSMEMNTPVFETTSQFQLNATDKEIGFDSASQSLWGATPASVVLLPFVGSPSTNITPPPRNLAPCGLSDVMQVQSSPIHMLLAGNFFTQSAAKPDLLGTTSQLIPQESLMSIMSRLSTTRGDCSAYIAQLCFLIHKLCAVTSESFDALQFK